MDPKNTYSTAIPCFMADWKRELKPVAFFDLAQQMAMIGGNYCGFGENDLKKFGIVWVLARMEVKFLKPVLRDDVVTINTWHRGQEGLFFNRDYEMLNEAGERVAVGTSAWIFMNFETRRAVRGDRVDGLDTGNPQCTDRVLPEDAHKVVFPRGVEPELIGSHTVRNSDVDVNRHANNAKYVEWIMNYLPDELVYNSRVSSICINYNKEARPGETVDLLHVETEGVHYVEGKVGDDLIFTSSIEFE